MGSYGGEDHLDVSSVGKENQYDMTIRSSTVNGVPSIAGSHSTSSPVAIIGMGMRLPGGANDPSSFWEFLINKRDGRGPIPKSRYNVDGFYCARQKPGVVTVDHGYFLDDVDLSKLDTSFFSMSKAEVERLDPQQRLLLELVWETFENAGEKNWRGKDIGCYVGSFGEDWLDMHAKDTQDFGMYRISGNGDFLLGNRISYEYDLRGPSITVKVGCSSSLLCLHLACEALQRGDCSSAIVAGSNLILSPTMTMAMCEQGVLSADASCKSFDTKADGYARAEAVNVVYIKKLADAIRDGNPVRAIIRASSSNCDGKTSGITNPNSDAHESLIRNAYAAAGLDMSETAMVECHGTGTEIGDPLEVGAIANCFGHSGVYLGSVKPNVGHSEGASGITSVIKSVLALERKTIIPNIKFTQPNPKIPFVSARLTVPIEPTAWPATRKERISVNSFGIGGANAHVILDSAASFGLRAHIPTEQNGTELDDEKSDKDQAGEYKLLPFSANHPQSLRKIIENYEQYMKDNPLKLKDLAYTLGARREHLAHRVFSVTDGTLPLEVSPIVKCRRSTEIVCVFTGQGAQWPGMGKVLMDSYPRFVDSIRTLDQALAKLKHPPGWTLEELLKGSKFSSINEAEFAQPLCTAVQIGLVDLLCGWGVVPAATVGHSSGEIAAAYAAGALTRDAAIVTAYYRGFAVRQRKAEGGMAAVGLGRGDVSAHLVTGVTIACENSARSVTVSGDTDRLATFLSNLQNKRPGVFVRQLPVDVAYHSEHMQAVGILYENLIHEHVLPRQLRIPFYSSVTGEIVSNGECLGSAYWRRNLESPVLFYSAIKDVLNGPLKNSTHLEIGPHSSLAGPLRQIYDEAGSSIKYISALSRNSNSTFSLLTAMGHLHSIGVEIDFATINRGGITLPDLPTYPWHHEHSYWHESRVSKEWRQRKFPHHDLLGSRIIEGNDLEPTWRNVLRLVNIPWLRDHSVDADVVFPAAGYVVMAGEAIRQLSGDQHYTLKDVSFSTALVLHDSKPTEIMAILRPSQLTTTLDSVWHEFSIASYSGSLWIKHCSGLVRGGSALNYSVPLFKQCPRTVQSRRWYEAMRRVGLNYGPAFTGMKNISAGIAETSATATVLDQPEIHESPYPLHPTTLDLAFQLMSVAGCKGQPRLLDTLYLPAYIELLNVRGGTGKEIALQTDVSISPRYTVANHTQGFSDGELIFSVKGMKLSIVEHQKISEDFDHCEAARLVWKPDIDFMDASTLIRSKEDLRSVMGLAERLGFLCLVENSIELESVSTSFNHLENYRQWMRNQISIGREGRHPIVKDAAELLELSPYERRALIGTLMDEVQDMKGAAAIGAAISRVYTSARGIFEAKIDPLDLLLQDNVLGAMYDVGDMWDHREFFELVSHSKPNLRILEIGAGTGGFTATVLNSLASTDGNRMYSKYVFTDISAGFFVAAKERFKNHVEVEYAVLDISKDPIIQGFQAQSFDIILAANVLHATPMLNQTLRHVRTLLHPQGRLFLQELCATSKWMNYVMGTLPSWWLGHTDGRAEEPYISPERWDKELRDAGFGGSDTCCLDHDYPYQINANIVAKHADIPVPKRVTLLVGTELSQNAYQAEALFARKGYEVNFCTLIQEPPPNQDIISLLDLDAPFFNAVTEKDLQRFLTLVKKLGSSAILWITRSIQMRCSNPDYALVSGMARTIRSELYASFVIFELDCTQPEAWSSVLRVFQKLQRRAMDQEQDHESEYALSKGLIHTSRFHWFSMAKELSTFPHKDRPKKLEIGKRGLLQTLHWVPIRLNHLEPEEVEVEVRAAGLNFKDILIAMNMVDGEGADGNGLGYECAGVIKKIGSDVKDLQVGDRVMAVHASCLATNIKTLSRMCVRIPDSLSFGNAATMPCVYSTVIRSLIEVGRLEAHQTVLIHSAAGGVGIAAVQISKMIGAEIYVTVGTEEKARFLQENFGIPRDRIYHSRDETFRRDILLATNGRGVDLVLNSLSGDLLHASWECVAEFGVMIEIGKRDLIGRGKLRMDIFEANRGYFGVDLSKIRTDQPVIQRRLLASCVNLYENGKIKPIEPITRFQASAIEDAFRYMQKGEHHGKIIIEMPTDREDLPAAEIPQECILRSDVSYLLVGGLGGLGKSVATWMVEHGATSLIFLSRSAGESSADQEFLAELNALGCSSQTFAGDVSKIQDVKNVVNSAAKPIAGVLQMSMVLKDETISQMTQEGWETVYSPKVQGTWNLHAALEIANLDFFILFSSFSGLVGQWGQASYAAANTFLDAFTQYRHQLGLPASVLDLGAVQDVGYVSQNPKILGNFSAAGVQMLREQDLLKSLHLLISRSVPPFSFVAPSPIGGFTNRNQVALGLRSSLPMSHPDNHIIWRRDPRMRHYHNFEVTSAARDPSSMKNDLQNFLATMTTDPAQLKLTSSTDFLAHEIGIRIFTFLMRPEEDIDLSVSLAALGVDSLIAIEIRNWLHQNLGIQISVLEMLGAAGSIGQLGKLAAERLEEKLVATAPIQDEVKQTEMSTETYLANKAL